MIRPPIDPFHILKIWGYGEIYSDISKKVSQCRICSEPIPKKTRRIAHTTRLGAVRQFPNGGIMTGRRSFYHPECITAKFMTSDVIPRTRRGHCGDCDAPLDGGDRNYAAMSTRSLWAHICDACSKSPRWALCDYCAVHYPRYAVRTVVNETANMRVKTSRPACRFCIEDRNLVTRASIQRKLKLEEQMNDRYKRIRNELAEHGL